MKLKFAPNPVIFPCHPLLQEAVQRAYELSTRSQALQQSDYIQMPQRSDNVVPQFENIDEAELQDKRPEPTASALSAGGEGSISTPKDCSTSCHQTSTSGFSIPCVQSGDTSSSAPNNPHIQVDAGDSQSSTETSQSSPAMNVSPSALASTAPILDTESISVTEVAHSQSGLPSPPLIQVGRQTYPHSKLDSRAQSVGVMWSSAPRANETIITTESTICALSARWDRVAERLRSGTISHDTKWESIKCSLAVPGSTCVTTGDVTCRWARPLPAKTILLDTSKDARR